MVPQNKPARTVKTARTVFSIVEALSAREGGTITEVADELGLAKSTVHDHLTTLGGMGYVVNDEGTYRNGLRFLHHGIQARSRLDILGAARTPLFELAETTKECAWLVVEEHDEAVFLEKEMGEHAVQTLGRVGLRDYLHTTAAGKAILAHLPEKRIDSIIENKGLPARTANTITNVEELEEELATIQQRGISVNEEESNRGVRALSSPVLHKGDVVGALAVSGPKSRLSDEGIERTIINELRNAVNVVELNLDHNPET